MKVIADFHIHSKFSRATGQNMNISEIASWAKLKGIKILGTGDITHPLWLGELKKHLKDYSEGVYEYQGIFFFLTGEVSNIYSKSGMTRKVHNIIFVPSFEVIEKINEKISRYGKLTSDGRPILSLDSDELVKIVMDISSKSMVIPAHAWTPHFSVFGSNSGFDSLEECFPTQRKNIYCIETGLSSDPFMNWCVSELDSVTLISNSDAHSPSNIGREANVFNIDSLNDIYSEIISVLKEKNKTKFLYTIEFFPEEGKYHYDGHRTCGVRMSPEETFKYKGICPVCGKKLTVGVLNRVKELSDREFGVIPEGAIPFKSLIPLEEIIADVTGRSKGTVSVRNKYLEMINKFGNEFDILLDISEKNLYDNIKGDDFKIVDAIIKVRRGEVKIEPGYDGEYGKISIAKDNSVSSENPQQLSFL